jgi:aminopeptidase N
LYYSAAAGGLDPGFAKETLAIALTDELPTSMVTTLINWVAAEHRELALDFAQANLDALASKQSPSFRTTFIPNLMANFADPARAAELLRFGPGQETSGSRIVSARVQERILTDAEFVGRQLPEIESWISRQDTRQ